jgi:NitT/TauT family transport system ATP-binding protein
VAVIHQAQRARSSDALLAIQGLGIHFERAGVLRPILEDIDLDVADGEFVTIVGPSGSGKTTLLRLAHGLLKPSAGAVFFRGEEVRSPDRRRGFVFQSDRLLPWRKVIDNVAFSLEVQGIRRPQALDRARKMLETIGLGEAAQQYPAQLSGGMRQRVNLARALVIDPDVLFMDEPFASLDAQTRDVLQMELLYTWQRHKKTVLFVTHQLDEAVYLADRVVVLSANPGKIRAIVPVDLPRPRDLDVKHTPEFAALVDRLWRLLRSDVLGHRRVGPADGGLE